MAVEESRSRLSVVSVMVTPVLAIILGTFWLNEELSPRVFSGAAFVLCGILAANGKELIGRFSSKQSIPIVQPEKETV